MERELTEREKAILRTIIHLYILKAIPIGSRSLSKYIENDLKLSSATIRNIMSDLEEMDLISHPHTSAGRIPTDKGYRFYVDELMKIEHLNEKEVFAVNDKLNSQSSDAILKSASKVLGMLSKYLGIVAIPNFSDMILIKIELIALSSDRLLIVIALNTNIIKTVTLEAEFGIDIHHLDNISRFINDRVSGKPLKYIRENFAEIISDYSNNTPLIRLFIESVNKIFQYNDRERLHLAGAPNLLSYPEFEDLSRVKGVIELIENEDVIVHLLDKYEDKAGVQIVIGSELQNKLLEDYSMIVTNYHLGGASSGSIGLIGPKRMNYSKMISLVGYVSELISMKY